MNFYINGLFKYGSRTEYLSRKKLDNDQILRLITNSGYFTQIKSNIF